MYSEKWRLTGIPIDESKHQTQTDFLIHFQCRERGVPAEEKKVNIKFVCRLQSLQSRKTVTLEENIDEIDKL